MGSACCGSKPCHPGRRGCFSTRIILDPCCAPSCPWVFCPAITGLVSLKHSQEKLPPPKPCLPAANPPCETFLGPQSRCPSNLAKDAEGREGRPDPLWHFHPFFAHTPAWKPHRGHELCNRGPRRGCPAESVGTRQGPQRCFDIDRPCPETVGQPAAPDMGISPGLLRPASGNVHRRPNFYHWAAC